jgi:hypothetical protein
MTEAALAVHLKLSLYIGSSGRCLDSAGKRSYYLGLPLFVPAAE